MSATDSNTDPPSSPRFFWQVYSIYGVMIALGGWFFGLLLCERFSQDILSNFQIGIVEQTKAYTQGWSDLEEAALITAIEKSNNNDQHIELITGDGTRFLYRHPKRSSTTLSPVDSLEGVSESLRSGIGYSNFTVQGAKSSHPSVTLAFESKNGTNYLLRLERDPRIIISQINAIFDSVIMLGLISALLAMVMGHLLYRRINRQFHVLTQVAVAYSEGNFSARAPKGMDSESILLGEALNKLADEIQDQISEIHLEHNRMRVILGGMRDGLIAIDELGKIVLINSVMSRILGFEIREARGRHLSEVIQDPEIIELLLNTLRVQRPLEAEFDLNLEPSKKSFKAYTSPLIDYEQDVSGALIVVHDLTQTRQLESMRRDFVANVSHELKTPITAIRGIAETLYDDEGMKPEIRQGFLGKITDQSHRLSTLVSDLLALARLDEKDSTTTEPIDLREIILERINSLSKVSSPDSQASLHYHGPEHPVFVLGDDEELRQAIGNLIDNGLKYTQLDGNINTHLSVEDGTATVLVKDDGVGIPEEFLGRIFERFFRVDKARSREIGGTGLGLAIVKHICLKHMGSIEVESQEGKGTTFRVKLPIFNGKFSSESHTE